MRISQILQFEKLRDGGSLLVSFKTDDSCEYLIMFPIEESNLGSETFKRPVLINRAAQIEIELNREHAMAWLRSLEYFFQQRSELSYVTKEVEQAILNKMLHLCS